MQSCFPQEGAGQSTHSPTITMLLMENFFHLSLPLILLSLSNSPNPDYLWGCYPAVLGVDPEKKVLSFLPAGWWRSALLFSKALHSLFPCPHASLHCSAHTLLLRPPLTVLLLFLQLPILLPSLLLQLPPAMLPVPFLDPPTTTPVYCIYYAVLPRGHPPIFWVLLLL